MGKFYKRVLRRDRLEDHAHALPDGRMTMGMQGKPNANHRAGWHTHIYQHDGMVYETDAAYDGADHAHDVPEFGSMTSGPMPVSKSQGEELSRMDSVQREGDQWVVRSSTGHVLGYGDCRHDALDMAFPGEDETPEHLKQA